MAAHSRFGGSVADRFINCPGSVTLCESVPKREVGVQAEIGTAAHALAEECLKTNTDAADHRDEFFPRENPGRFGHFIVEDDMIAAVQIYLDEVRSEQALTPDAELYVEQGFVLDIKSAERGEVFGTNDAMVYHPSTGRLRVFDYKHGQGVSVSAEDNSQLKFYALGALDSHPDWAVSELILTIVQPRARDAGDTFGIKDWSMEVDEILAFQDTLEVAISNAKGDGPLLYSGSWCRWCDAAAVCPAKQAEALKSATLDFADVTMVSAAALPEPKDLDLGRLAKIVEAADILNAWAAQCQEYLEVLVLGGHQVPGWKAVEKIGRANWVSNPADVVDYAGMLFGLDEDQVMPRKLVTITEMEKALKAAGAAKKEIDSFKLKFTIKESSGLTVARASDKRPAVDALAADFKSVNPNGFGTKD